MYIADMVFICIYIFIIYIYVYKLIVQKKDIYFTNKEYYKYTR